MGSLDEVGADRVRLTGDWDKVLGSEVCLTGEGGFVERCLPLTEGVDVASALLLLGRFCSEDRPVFARRSSSSDGMTSIRGLPGASASVS